MFIRYSHIYFLLSGIIIFFINELFLDELKHIIGSETTRRGLITVFDLFQRPILNQRLLYVLLEGILCTLFPDKDMHKLFIKLYSKSNNTEHQESHKSR